MPNKESFYIFFFYQVSNSQVAKMSLATMDKEKEMNNVKSKLDSMIKLNKTLSAERSDLLEKLKQ